MAVLENQRGYHRSTADRMNKLDRRLEFAGLSLFVATIGAALAFLVAEWSRLQTVTVGRPILSPQLPPASLPWPPHSTAFAPSAISMVSRSDLRAC